jgi:hypothetical protein
MLTEEEFHKLGWREQLKYRVRVTMLLRNGHSRIFFCKTMEESISEMVATSEDVTAWVTTPNFSITFDKNQNPENN